MKSPAFQFYNDDFIGGTASMSQSEVGAYIRLLCYQWGHGSIPDDPGKLRRIAGGAVSPDVLTKFPDGKNQRLEGERKKQNEFRQKQRDKGKRSAAVRWGSDSTNGQPESNRGYLPVTTEQVTNWQPEGQPDCNSPSPISYLRSPEGTKTLGEQIPAVVARKARPTTSPDEFIAKLSADPTYAGIDVRREFGKMANWCERNRKPPTERRFVNWLNRVDVPLQSTVRPRNTDPNI